MFGFGNNFPEFPTGRNFEENYKCYSVTMLGERKDVEGGGKIIMPPSALDKLTRLNIQYPMLFKLTNKRANRTSHCGVLEFVADEGRIYIPYWMMRNMCVEEGETIQISNVSLQVATYAKFQPQSVEFLDISNPKAVLENALRNFACLTQGDVVAIKYNDKEYELCVLESKPGTAVSIIECDMSVDFAAPVGYQEPERQYRKMEQTDGADAEEEPMDIPESFMAFAGQGNRLDGKKKGTDPAPATSNGQTPTRRGIPNYNFKRGTISFIRTVKPAAQDTEEEDMFEAFSGQGQSLKKKNRK